MAAKSKSKKGLLVHQQLHFAMGNIIKLRETLVATIQTVAVCSRHIQVVTTAQEPKGLSCSTKGKLVGMVRRLQIETIRSQVLRCLINAMNAVQRLNGSGLTIQVCIEGLR